MFSGDSPAHPEEYARRMMEMKKEFELSGFVLMEHNHMVSQRECDLGALSEKYGLVILAGVEADTFWGHLLVYGMTGELWDAVQANKERKQEPISFTRTAHENGAVVVPAHPFRGFIGVRDRCDQLPGVNLIEGLNGANSGLENIAALDFGKRMGWAMTGGSDAHFLGELGGALTRLQKEVRTMDELVRELRAGRCEPLRLEQAKR